MGFMVYSLLWLMQDVYHQPYSAKRKIKEVAKVLLALVITGHEPHKQTGVLR